MVSQVGTVGQERSTMARQALRGNALFSLLSGALLLLGTGAVDSFLGLGSPLALRVVGVGLLAWAVWLLREAGRDALDPRVVRVAIAGDALWVGLTLVMLVAGWPPLSSAGRWALLFVADLVGLIALWEWLGLRRLT